ncbi:hypothetical protein SUGI_0846160 [Cryptomeria japonica]|uniref:uncharacterized protein LOC131055815 n=1 Tax=Cryptomeria japonica TaxID=3369 RepID=UPI002414BB3A|nr:uncharacterized protein LOC131055815 [Cryptomeria japonica]GLJ40901.1 hypothetical protein SUGI_0846160 [Cryptomeria japonica]
MGGRRSAVSCSAVWIIILCWVVALPWKFATGEKCGNISVFEPFGSGGSFPYANMVICNANKTLQFRTARGAFDVQSVDYESKSLHIWDPSLSTCKSLTPLGNQYFSPDSILPPSNDTTILLLNCSAKSVVTRNADHFCAESNSSNVCHDMYDDCPAFKGLLEKLPNSSGMACCVTSFARLGNLGIKELECSHYTSAYRRKESHEWRFGISLSFRESEEPVPDIGEFCERCDPARHGFQISEDHPRCGIGRQCICYPHKCEDDFFSGAMPNILPPTLIERIVLFFVLLAGSVLWMMI